mmetsp:Transcript_4805/g.8721  ORF Transcript_4805/g.8721 Transcript_4805/m.8721 type:complete len:468 (+) Transcript_4805:114-1517(+)
MIHVFVLLCIFGPLSAELETLCDTADFQCEDAPSYLEVSLLQLEVQVDSERGAQASAARISNQTKPLPSVSAGHAVHSGHDGDSSHETRQISQSSQVRKLEDVQLHAIKLTEASQHKEEVSRTSSLQLGKIRQRVQGAGVFLVPILLCLLACIIIGLLVAKDDGIDSHPFGKGRPMSTWEPSSTRILGSGGISSRPPSSGLLRPSSTSTVGSASLLLAGGPRPPTRQSPPTAKLAAAPPTAMASGELTFPPPICPSLILPHTEARFMIAMDSLKRLSTGSVDILGTSGRKLLHAAVSETPDNRRCLAVASCGCEDDPRTCILTPSTAVSSSTGEGQSQDLEVYGKSGSFYGRIESQSGSNNAVLHYGEGQNPVMILELGSQEDLRITAAAVDGNLLSSGGRNISISGRQLEGSDAWKMQVKPGADAVLIASCMLALILLRPWSEDLRLASWQRSMSRGSPQTPQRFS